MGQVRCHLHDTISLDRVLPRTRTKMSTVKGQAWAWHRVDLYSSVCRSSLITMGNFVFENNMVLTQDYKGQEVKAKQILVLHLVCIGIYCIYTT